MTTEPHNKAEVANSISADSKTIAGSFPPNSKNAGIKRSAAAIAICCPVSTLPVKHTRSTLSTKAAPVLPSPSTKVNISRSCGILLITFIKGVINRGVISLGLTITAQPANNAGIVSIVDNSKGKFQGLIIPTKE